MQSISEILQTIARQHARGDTLPLISLTPIPGATSERISHLPIDTDLSQAWVALVGAPFRPHQAHALTALRRGEAVALQAASADVVMTAYLLLYATLAADPAATALVLAPDQAALDTIYNRLASINQELPRGLRCTTTQLDTHQRPNLYARIVVATPELLHQRLLRHHDRAWRLFWPQLRLVVLPDMQRYTGVAIAHLADLLTRTQRIAASHSGQLPNLLGTLTELVDAAPTLAGLTGSAWRVIPADDGGHAASALAIWRGGASWARDVAELSIAFQRQGYPVQIVCTSFEQALLAPMVDDLPQIVLGNELGEADVLVVVGYSGSQSTLRRMVHSGYRAVVLVLGDLPQEQALVRHGASLLNDPVSAWIPAPANAYVLARHVLCAASELPLTASEVDAWGARAIVDRLVTQGQLVDLPDAEVAWKPTTLAGDPYIDFSLYSAVGAASAARTEQGHLVGLIEPSDYERWAFPRAALPAGKGGFRVIERAEEQDALTLRMESNGRRSYPLRRGTIELREIFETRAITNNCPLGWGRVLMSEEIYGFREAAVGSAAADIAIQPTLNVRWAAPACWFDLHIAMNITGQMIGWSLAAALPLRVLADFTDTVSYYDHSARRLYLVDAQPGGNGVAYWIYQHAEALLPLAYDIALACRSDALLEPLSRNDMDWLLMLLGRQAPDAAQIERPKVMEPARKLEYIPAPAPLEYTTDAGDESEALKPHVPPPQTNPAPMLRPQQPISQVTARSPAPNEQHSASPPNHLDRPTAREQPAESPAQTHPAPRTRPEPSKPQPKHAERPTRAVRPRPQSRGSASAAPTASSRSSSSITRPQPALAPADDADAPPDPAALIARLRQQRQQRETEQAAQKRRNSVPTPSDVNDETLIETRFASGERVFCLPYGDGVVRASWLEEGRELLTVTFPTHGDLTIDPAVSLVRKLEDAPEEDDDLL